MKAVQSMLLLLDNISGVESQDIYFSRIPCTYMPIILNILDLIFGTGIRYNSQSKILGHDIKKTI